MWSWTERILGSAPWFLDILDVKKQLDVGIVAAINWLKLDISSQGE